MGIDELHKRKFSKNMAVLGMIFGFCALIWAVTMIKISSNIETKATTAQTTLPDSANTVE